MSASETVGDYEDKSHNIIFDVTAASSLDYLSIILRVAQNDEIPMKMNNAMHLQCNDSI